MRCLYWGQKLEKHEIKHIQLLNQSNSSYHRQGVISNRDKKAIKKQRQATDMISNRDKKAKKNSAKSQIKTIDKEMVFQ